MAAVAHSCVTLSDWLVPVRKSIAPSGLRAIAVVPVPWLTVGLNTVVQTLAPVAASYRMAMNP